MKRALGILSAAFFAVGCGAGAGKTDFKNGTATSEMVRLNTPGAGNSGSNNLVGADRFHGYGSGQRLQGVTAGTYEITRIVTAVVNGGTAAVLDLIRDIVSYPATTVSTNQAVWGPWTGDLSPTTYKLTVKKVGTDTYSYTLDGKPKSGDDSAYVTLISGTHTASVDAAGNAQANYGHGSFSLDFTAQATLPDTDNNSGQLQVTYARPDATSATTVDVSFINYHDHGDAADKVSNALYHYDDTPGQGGKFTFQTQANIDADPSRPAAENLSVESRWHTDGAGRSDLTAEGGDLSNPATLSECWDSNFKSQFLDVSWDTALNYGTESTDCAFTTAEFPAAP